MISRSRSRLAALAAACALALLAAATAEAAPPQPRPHLGSDSAILIDANSGDVLLQQAAAARRPIASTTKLMTARLALERAKPSEVFTAPAYHALPQESQIHLRAGERMAVRDLMRALLLESANDAAETLAVGVSGSVRSFVHSMNAEARKLGLSHTHYTNPIGLDQGPNYSSARDLATLARLLMQERAFARIVDMTQARLTSGSHLRVVHNRNLLVGRYPFVNGVKTGHTRKAGYVLVGSGTSQDAHVISVVLGEPSEAARDNDTVTLLRYGLGQFHRVRVLSAARPVAKLDVKYFGGKAGVGVARNVAVSVRRGRRAQVKVSLPDELEGPLPAGRRVGSARIYTGGRLVKRVALVTKEPVPGASTLRKVATTVGPALITLVVLAVLFAGTLVVLRARAVRTRRRSPRTTTR
ncbi:MAG TPA: D-alanyl-D-alanine carboxypeptidase family protein [Thermoleophilaceae bacterium]